MEARGLFVRIDGKKGKSFASFTCVVNLLTIFTYLGLAPHGVTACPGGGDAPRVLDVPERAPETSYSIGVYVLCDQHLTSQLQGRNKKDYFGAYFNTINLIFAQLKDIQVTFKVVEVETTYDTDQMRKLYTYTPSLKNPHLPGQWPDKISVTTGYVNESPTTVALAKYLKDVGAPYNNSHVLVLFTGRGALYGRVEHDVVNKGSRAPLHVHSRPERGRICNPDGSIIVTQDNGYFSDVMRTARKLTRLLGANYDLHKDAKCLYTSGMLMGNNTKKESPVMSPCTQREVTAKLRSNNCKLKKIDLSKAYSTQKLPAQMTTPDSYCQLVFPGKYNMGQCTEEKWSLSGYQAPGSCQEACCYGSLTTWRRNPQGYYLLGAPLGHRCNDARNGACIQDYCVATRT